MENILKRLGERGAPYVPRVKLKIGSKDFGTIPNDHIVSFSAYKKPGVTKSLGSAELDITLFDETAIEVEYYISSADCTANPSIKYSYGYEGTEEWSEEASCYLASYSIEFGAAGMTLSLQGTSTATPVTGEDGGDSSATGGNGKMRADYTKYENAKTDESGNVVEGTPIGYDRVTDAVKEIAKDMGWNTCITDSAILTGENKFGLNGELKTTGFARTDAQGFIAERIMDCLQSESGQSNYKVEYITTNGKTTIHLHPMIGDGTGCNMCGETIEVDYHYGNGLKGDCVISFSAQFNSLAAAYAGMNGITAAGVDPNTNEIVTGEANSNSYPEEYVMGGRKINVGSAYRRVAGTSSLTEAQMDSFLRNLWFSASMSEYEASMDMIGDPKIFPNMWLFLTVTNKYGLPHHTTGIYEVFSCTDSISGGNFTTSLELKKKGIKGAPASATVVGGNGTEATDNPTGNTKNENVSGTSYSNYIPGVAPGNDPEYKQSGEEWSDDAMGENGKTVGSVGCLITSLATLMYLSGDESANPGSVNQYVRSNGGYMNGTSSLSNTGVNGFGTSGFKYGGSVSLSGKSGTDSVNTIKEYLSKGYWVVVCVNNGNHWVPITSVGNNDLGITDTILGNTHSGLLEKYAGKIVSFKYYSANNPFKF